MFEEQYNELWTAVDEIAERIRTLGFPAPATYREFSAFSSIQETEGVPAVVNMLKILTNGHEQIVKTCRSALSIAQAVGDESSASLVSDRMRVHEKTAWMLRATL